MAALSAVLLAVAAAASAAPPASALRHRSKADAVAVIEPVREVAPGAWLVPRSRDLPMPYLTVDSAETDGGAARQWASTTRCDDRRAMIDGNVCLQSFLSGEKVAIRLPYVDHGSVLPTLTTVDGKPLRVTEFAGAHRVLPDGDAIEVVELAGEAQRRLKSPWGDETLYPQARFQNLVGGSCSCIVGLRRLAPDGRVRWAWAYFWHPGGYAEARGKVESDPIPAPLLALNEFQLPAVGNLALATSGARIFPRAENDRSRSWPVLVVGIRLFDGQLVSELAGLQAVPFESLVQATVDEVHAQIRRGQIKPEDSTASDGRRDVWLQDDFADHLYDHLLEAWPRLRATWTPGKD
jgi:hypothetical protein